MLQLAHLTRNATFFTQFWHLDKVYLEAEQLQDELLNHKLTKLGIYLDINCNGSSSVLNMVRRFRKLSSTQLIHISFYRLIRNVYFRIDIIGSSTTTTLI